MNEHSSRVAAQATLVRNAGRYPSLFTQQQQAYLALLQAWAAADTPLERDALAMELRDAWRAWQQDAREYQRILRQLYTTLPPSGVIDERGAQR